MTERKVASGDLPEFKEYCRLEEKFKGILPFLRREKREWTEEDKKRIKNKLLEAVQEPSRVSFYSVWRLARKFKKLKMISDPARFVQAYKELPDEVFELEQCQRYTDGYVTDNAIRAARLQRQVLKQMEESC